VRESSSNGPYSFIVIFFILTLAFSLTSAGTLSANTSIGIDAYAKKSKESSEGNSNGNGSSSDKGGSSGGGSRPGIGSGYGSSNSSSDYRSNDNSNSKLVILAFDDGFQNQYTYAKPILDKYNFKASFFVVCNYAGKPGRMSWQEITTLYDEGYDVESHSMNHNHMNIMTPDELNYEIGQSKQCLADHGINATIFAYPFDIQIL
jgi:hypothetical protein